MTVKRFFYFPLILAAGFFCLNGPAFAAQQPNAGQTLQELRSRTLSPKSSKGGIAIEAPKTSAQKPGGPQVMLRSIHFKGNVIFSDKELLKLVQGAEGKSFDLAGLNTLADRITDYYHRHDYPFALALIPEQSMKDGVLEIEVVEGRYGEIKIIGNDPRAKSAQAFLSSLKTGDVIRGKPLERVSLLLNDQPGYLFVPVIRPGQKTGTGDLSLKMQRENLFNGSIRFDNNGNRYTGRLRALASLSVNGLFCFGDQISLNGIYSQWNTWFGSAGYSLPLGHSGLRGNIGYTYTYYQLGKEFSSLNAHGTAQVLSGGLSYPLIRSQKTNLALSVSYQHKWLRDREGDVSTDDTKSSNSMPVTLNFDHHDGLLGGGVTYGALSWTYGVLDLDNGLAITDSSTAKSNGTFHKMNMDIARLQTLPWKFSLYGRAAGQMSFNNLDSSEDFGLGGPTGVRAYPVGEGYGDEGLLTQGELRYPIWYFSPYGFYDYGYTRTNQHTWTGGDNDRNIAGGGVGLRFNYKNLSADCSVAWRSTGNPESDSRHQIPTVWFNVGYRV